MTESLTFLPWLRRGLGGGFTLDEGATRPQIELRPEATAVEAGRTDTQPCAPVRVQLAGPGEVRTIDERLILRRWPAPHSREAPSNHFPLVELRDPDLPWRYSPIPPSGERMHPWFALLVLKVATAGIGERGEFEWRGRARGAPLRSILVREGTALPDLSQSWAWAHVQLAGRVAEGGIADALATPGAIARVLAPRLLETDRQYAALLVPTFERGRLAGLGRDPGPTRGDARAWAGTVAAGLELPVFHAWTFSTSRASLDFEAILNGLQATAAPVGLGVRPLHVSVGGQDLVLPLAGALTPVNHTQAAIEHRAAMMNALDQDQATEGDTRPVVRPPTYGGMHAGRGLDPSAVALGWLEELNLDPRWRVVASLGVEAVRRYQEAYMAAAWEVVAEVRRLNERLAAQQVALLGLRRVHADLVLRGSDRIRRLLTLRPLGDARFHAVMRDARELRAFRALGEPQLLRVVRPQGALGRRAGLRAPEVLPSLGLRLSGATLASTVALARVRVAPTLSLSLGPLKELATTPGLSPAAGIALTERLGGELSALGLDGLAPELGLEAIAATREGPAGIDAALTGGFPLSFAGELADAEPDWVEALQTSLDRSLPAPVDAAGDDSDLCVALAEGLAALGATLDPDQSVVRRVEVHVGAGHQFWSPVQAVPRFEGAVAERLEELGQAWLLPGLDGLDAERVTCVQTNPAFVEAFLAGMNHELARELLWREYPTDQRGTAFARFWPALSASAPEDIRDMHLWSAKLGANAPDGVERSPRLVLLFRSALFCRFPGTRVYLLRAGAREGDGAYALDWDQRERENPTFFDRMGEYAYFGFDLDAAAADDEPGWFVVFEEQVAEPRFGADVPEAEPRALIDGQGHLDWSALSWAHILGPEWERQRGSWLNLNERVRAQPDDASGSVPWLYSAGDPTRGPWTHAAELARCTFQMPVRRAIHLSDLIPPQARRSATLELPAVTLAIPGARWRTPLSKPTLSS